MSHAVACAEDFPLLSLLAVYDVESYVYEFLLMYVWHGVLVHQVLAFVRVGVPISSIFRGDHILLSLTNFKSSHLVDHVPRSQDLVVDLLSSRSFPRASFKFQVVSLLFFFLCVTLYAMQITCLYVDLCGCSLLQLFFSLFYVCV